jgi:tellurite resistance protein
MNGLPAEDALIYVMVVASAADASMADKELAAIGAIVRSLPAFAAYDSARLIETCRTCAAILQEKDGLDTVIGLAARALSPNLRETAYALACDVAAADGRLAPEELGLLRRVRAGLGIERLVSAAIERAAHARYQRV